MITLTNQDLQFVVRRIPKDVREQLMTLPIYIAGGFIRETIAGGDVKDIDLFGETKEALASFAETLAAKRQVRTHKTDNAITVLCPPRLPIQYITRWTFASAGPLVESFDFTVCQAVIWFDRTLCVWRSLCGEGFYPDLAARRLVYTFPVRVYLIDAEPAPRPDAPTSQIENIDKISPRHCGHPEHPGCEDCTPGSAPRKDRDE